MAVYMGNLSYTPYKWSYGPVLMAGFWAHLVRMMSFDIQVPSCCSLCVFQECVDVVLALHCFHLRIFHRIRGTLFETWNLKRNEAKTNGYSALKFNINPQNRHIWKEIHFPIHPFWVAMLNFQGVSESVLLHPPGKLSHFPRNLFEN